ncbi:MAG: hypothetical protein H7338_09905 [Candidatus Sericytochromatia bacterium]|nr:hypothetical protein [Candidatus Sericytochromatia bacterium]
MLLVGLLVALGATLCIASGRLLSRIRDDASGKIILALGGFFLALDVIALRSHIFWVAPLSLVSGVLIGNHYIRKRGLRG